MPRFTISDEPLESKGRFTISDGPDGDTPTPKGMSKSAKEKLSRYVVHPVLEGGAMAVGGLAGALSGPAAPVAAPALAVGMYPVGKQAAIGVDRLMGLETRPDAKTLKEAVKNEVEDLQEGLLAEAGGKLIGPVVRYGGKALGAVLPGARTGEALSGTPHQNLSRAFNKGLKETYYDPKPLAQASQKYGEQEAKLLAETLTPEEQAATVWNARGAALERGQDIYTRWLKKEPISPEEALYARQAVDKAMPAEVARNNSTRHDLNEFRAAMNDILLAKAPAFKAANDEYADSILRAHLTRPFRVNKSDPMQYSKLGAMLATVPPAAKSLVSDLDVKSGLWALASLLGASPLAMGLTAAGAGTGARAVSRAANNPAVRRWAGTAAAPALRELLGMER